MAPSNFPVALCLLSLIACNVNGQLTATFYQRSCPNLQGIVRSAMAQAVAKEKRMGASILRLFFHDCFVNGCDASILLDDTATFTGEKNAGPNKNSARGFEVIDDIKSKVEAKCNATVSCADILALAARDGVVAVSFHTNNLCITPAKFSEITTRWSNMDSPTAPSSSLSTLTSMFATNGLTARDLTALSGAHTIGQARCATFRPHIYNDTNINAAFASTRQANCPASGGDDNLAPLDALSPNQFGNDYYKDLVGRKGLLHSDQELFNNGTQDALVRQYSVNGGLFARDFASAMVKMGGIGPLTGSSGQIRLNCRKVNS
ncbi:uncharacterized protein A4U43_C01F19250 [Asparagus officinalis]|uniref:Peroxidase n=1 Tax=Asparagus officinalis TaxID=4686 RepID=A0A5P1FQJ4_ASPOF|nr:uncharacterized protein A4U43_C01F19250 [Asparagus officinalis]